jgi:subtilisin-like proprotein convertase family protein
MGMHMKGWLVSTLMLAFAWGGRAGTYSFNWSVQNGAIPDGNPIGTVDSRTLIGLGSSIQDVNVTLNITGGWNGDLYAYLAHDSGFAVLLNRAGRTENALWGYGDGGVNVTLDDTAESGDIHLYGGNSGGPLTGLWQPDGRNADPASVTDATPQLALLSSFNGSDANGTWTLFFADLSGGGQSQLVSWGLEITTIPEPANLTLIFLAGLLGRVCRHRRNRLKQDSIKHPVELKEAATPDRTDRTGGNQCGT